LSHATSLLLIGFYYASQKLLYKCGSINDKGGGTQADAQKNNNNSSQCQARVAMKNVLFKHAEHS
jgi:hypothetical protein